MRTTADLTTMSDGDFAKLRAIIHKCTGITIGETRKSMLISRLRKRLKDVDAPSFGSYIAQLSDNPKEIQEMTNLVTTNETYFYRTPRVWEYFQDEFVPEFLEKNPNRTMHVWSGAASTGEEAHTIGVLLEQQRQTQSGFDYSVLGTDVSSRVLDIANSGTYRGRSVARFKNARGELFAKHMVGSEAQGYKVAPDIKTRIRFKLHNLLRMLDGTHPFDAIFLRNVLIYFTPEDQEKILANIRKLIKPEGVLFIGESESLTRLNTDFEQVAPIVYKPVARKSGPVG